MHSEIKLIVTDLDGTFLSSEGRVLADNVDAALRARAHGVPVTVASGRMFASARRFAEAMGAAGDEPLICYNGAMIRRMDGTIVSHTTLDVDIARRCLAMLRARGIYVQSYTDDELLIASMEASEYEYYLAHYGIVGRIVGDALYDQPTPPTKLLALTRGYEETTSMMAMMRETFGERIYATSSDPILLELMAPTVSKSGALRELAQLFGVDMQSVMAIGDGDNDADMIAAAGVGVAMGNARPAPKAAADIIVPTNDECGFAAAIDAVLFGKDIV